MKWQIVGDGERRGFWLPSGFWEALDKDLLHKSPFYATDITEDPQDTYGRDARMKESKSLLSRSPQSSGDADICELSHRPERNPDGETKESIVGNNKSRQWDHTTVDLVRAFMIKWYNFSFWWSHWFIPEWSQIGEVARWTPQVPQPAEISDNET